MAQPVKAKMKGLKVGTVNAQRVSNPNAQRVSNPKACIELGNGSGVFLFGHNQAALATPSTGADDAWIRSMMVCLQDWGQQVFAQVPNETIASGNKSFPAKEIFALLINTFSTRHFSMKAVKPAEQVLDELDIMMCSTDNLSEVQSETQ